MEKIINGKKKCTKCKRIKTLDKFKILKTVKSGITAKCSDCYKKYYKQYSKQNRDKMNAYFRGYYKSKTPSFGQPVVMGRNDKGQFAYKVQNSNL